ncbi:hypothetical protein QUF58_02700 [Anaerolineales bacterium HSG24]|nr:hypothetical protein [Anaerolineales bacterium HSG24]
MKTVFTMIILRTIPILITVTFVLFACNSIKIESAPPRIEPTPTEPKQVVIGRNRNAEALMSAKSEVGRQSYGFAPFLLLDDTRIVVENDDNHDDHGNHDNQQRVMLRYPPQSADPTMWETVDSFILAYATQRELLPTEAVSEATVGQFKVSAPIGNDSQWLTHYAVWVDFVDNSGTVVDLTDLGPDFGAYHPISRELISSQNLEPQFSEWQSGVPYDMLQPLAIVTFSGQKYYLLGQLSTSANSYDYAIQAHQIKPASHTEPLRLLPGSRIELSINQADFAELQTLIQEHGSTVFEDKPEMWQRYGDDGAEFSEVLEQNLHLLWHMVTKTKIHDQ